MYWEGWTGCGRGMATPAPPTSTRPHCTPGTAPCPLPRQDEIAELKRAEAAREKLVGDVLRENRRLAEPLGQVRGLAGWTWGGAWRP